MKNNRLLIILCVGAAILLSGCSKFLTVEKYGASTTWESKEDVDKAVAALWSIVSNEGEGVTGRGICWFECCSDNMTVGRPQSEANMIRDFKMAPNNGRDVKNTWPAMYQINTKANNIINVVPTLGFDKAYVNECLGIAYFWRGLAMLWIAPYYGDNGPNGGIPIILDDTEPAEMDAPRPKSVIQNYDQIISDMSKAAELLPYFSQIPENLYGRPHKAACWAFAARAALYASQWDKSYYKKVDEFCDKVMNLTGADKRDLYRGTSAEYPTAFADYWTRKNNFCSEYLFSLLGNPFAGPKFHGMSFQMDGWGLYNTWGYYQPTYGLWQAYDEKDQRRDATILFPGQHIRYMSKDICFGTDQWFIHSDTGMTMRKFVSPFREYSDRGKEFSTNGNDQSNTLGMCLIRYADVLLMKAEAQIALNGEGNAAAKECLGQIRSRAGLSAENPATWDELKLQRRLELAFEFMPSRHIDLIRWGDAEKTYAQPTWRINSHYDSATGTVVIDSPSKYDNGRTFDPVVNQVFPIPAAAFDGSVNLKQNIGY